MSEDVNPLECDHILYPVRDLQTMIHQYHECQVCHATFKQMELRDEFARVRKAAYERGKAEERARIVKDIERMIDEYLEEARKTGHRDMEKSHRQLARAYGYIANYLRGETINIVNQTE